MAFFYQAAEQQRFRASLNDFMSRLEQIQNEFSRKYDRRTAAILAKIQDEAEAAQAVRLEFPKFNGEDPKKWCSCAARYFDLYGTRDAQRLSISSLHMDGKTDVWFREVNATHTIPRWDDFV
jgi:hypothetical protein